MRPSAGAALYAALGGPLFAFPAGATSSTSTSASWTTGSRRALPAAAQQVQVCTPAPTPRGVRQRCAASAARTPRRRAHAPPPPSLTTVTDLGAPQAKKKFRRPTSSTCATTPPRPRARSRRLCVRARVCSHRRRRRHLVRDAFAHDCDVFFSARRRRRKFRRLDQRRCAVLVRRRRPSWRVRAAAASRSPPLRAGATVAAVSWDSAFADPRQRPLGAPQAKRNFRGSFPQVIGG